MTLDELIAAATTAGVGGAERLASYAKPGVRVYRDRSTRLHHITESRLGGRPMLPHDVEWPNWLGAPMAFIGQLGLGELPAIPPDLRLPTQGHLLFFFDASQDAFGSYPGEGDAGRVVFVDGTDTPSTTRPWPTGLADSARYSEVPLRFSEATTLPSLDSGLRNQLKLSTSEEDALFELLLTMEGGDECGLIGGHPDIFQRDPFREAAQAAAGIESPAWQPRDDPRILKVEGELHLWRLLFKVPWVQDNGMCSGDLGFLYYCIREDDLRERRFDRTWMVRQNS